MSGCKFCDVTLKPFLMQGATRSCSQESLFLIPWLHLEHWLASAIFSSEKKKWFMIIGITHSSFSSFNFSVSHLYREMEAWCGCHLHLLHEMKNVCKAAPGARLLCKDHKCSLFSFVFTWIVGKDPNTSIRAPWLKTPLHELCRRSRITIGKLGEHPAAHGLT